MAKISNVSSKVKARAKRREVEPLWSSLLVYGTETIRDLVPKVIRILELLELQAAKNEKETDELLEMKHRVERLELEKSETRELREKFDRELEVIEEQWRKEVGDLFFTRGRSTTKPIFRQRI